MSDCPGRNGHHYHEPDGTLYVRHNERKQGDVVTLHCCWCGESREGMPVYSRSPKPSPNQYPNPSACGEKVTL